MIKPVSLLLLAAVLCGSCGSRTGRTAATSCDEPSARPSEYVSTLVGTHSDFTLSTGNTYPAGALPWGMNFWTPQTGEMGSGWAYTYGAHTIRGLKQTHQPSPWINDYGSFPSCPCAGRIRWMKNRAKAGFRTSRRRHAPTTIRFTLPTTTSRPRSPRPSGLRSCVSRSPNRTSRAW